MPTQPGPRREHPSTYVVSDRSNPEELTRLQLQDDLITTSMGGVLPEQTDLSPFQNVLDIGCGTGNWLIELAKITSTCTRLVGVDVSLTFVEYARAQAEAAQVSDRVEFYSMDALRMLEFPARTFDLVNQRFGVSWLRTWDWPKLLQEMLRVARPGGVLRLTEGEIAPESPSLALTRLGALWIDALYQAGHLWKPQRGTSTEVLASLLERHRIEQVQACPYTLTYAAGTPEWQRFCENIHLGFQVIAPFLRKWVHLPDDYTELCHSAIREMHQPDFVATVQVLTVWGKVPFSA